MIQTVQEQQQKLQNFFKSLIEGEELLHEIGFQYKICSFTLIYETKELNTCKILKMCKFVDYHWIVKQFMQQIALIYRFYCIL